MPMEDLLSILLPVYNAEKTLGECLDSISAQSYSRFEVVAVDDGSDDRSVELLQAFAQKDPRIRILVPPRHIGIVAALNQGLEACRGDWIVRMDADDRMHPHRLETQYRYVGEHPQTDILGTRVTLFKPEGALTAGQLAYQDWSNSLLSHDEILDGIFAESPIVHPTFFVRKLFYQRLGGYQNNPWAEDYDFLLRACLIGGRFAKTAEVLLEKRHSPNRLARRDPRCKRKAMFQAKAHYFAGWRHWTDKSGLVIAGCGSTGRMANLALKQAGFDIAGFVDLTGTDRLVAGIPAYAIDQQRAVDFFQRFRRCLFLLCIGVPEGRKKMENLLQTHGFRPGLDYLRFI